MLTKNVHLEEGFKQVCVWQGTIVGPQQVEAFVEWARQEFGGVRVQYLEELVTSADETGPGGRNDLLFAVHSDDVGKFAVQRLSYGMRWIEDVYGNGAGHLYPARVAAYKTW